MLGVPCRPRAASWRAEADGAVFELTSLTTVGEETMTKLFGPKERRNTSPYAR